MKGQVIMENTKITKKCIYCGKPYFKKGNFEIPHCDCGCSLFHTDEFLERVRKREDLRIRYVNARFPVNIRKLRLNQLTCENKDEAGVYAHCFIPNNGRGYHYIGKNGNGKTTLAVCIGKELVAKGYNVRFITFSECIGLLQSTYSLKSKTTFKQKIKQILSYDFIIFDDFGKETYKDKTFSDVFEFLNAVYSQNKNIILTSNRDSVEKLKNTPSFLPILDRLKHIAKIRKFNNESYRSRSNEDEK